MSHATDPFLRPPPPAWTIALAFALIYLSWGTTYYAIRVGVHEEHLPPALFGGSRVCLGGLLVLLYLACRGERLRLPRREFFWMALTGLFVFVGGNGLITFAMDRIPSGEAAVLVATTPLLMALLEWFWPEGERLSPRGWVGLAIGLAGVSLLMVPRLQGSTGIEHVGGPLLVLGSAVCWSFGSLLLRHRRPIGGSHLVAAGYQMALGGGSLALVGLFLGEAQHMTAAQCTKGAAVSFLYLLVVGSLIGFVAFNWLLGHVPAPLVGTYAYVNPLVAVLVGWLLGHEEMTGWLVGGLLVILVGVALVRTAGVRRKHKA